MKQGRGRGWVSLPVLLVIAAITWQMHQQSESLNQESIWLKHRQIETGRGQWHEIFQALESRAGAGQSQLSHCDDFCSLSDTSWSVLRLADQTSVMHQHAKLPVERWCASLNGVTARCWWHQQNSINWSHLSVI